MKIIWWFVVEKYFSWQQCPLSQVAMVGAGSLCVTCSTVVITWHWLTPGWAATTMLASYIILWSLSWASNIFCVTLNQIFSPHNHCLSLCISWTSLSGLWRINDLSVLNKWRNQIFFSEIFFWSSSLTSGCQTAVMLHDVSDVSVMSQWCRMIPRALLTTDWTLSECCEPGRHQRHYQCSGQMRN